jgi:hypothetical protein
MVILKIYAYIGTDGRKQLFLYYVMMIMIQGRLMAGRRGGRINMFNSLSQNDEKHFVLTPLSKKKRL